MYMCTTAEVDQVLTFDLRVGLWKRFSVKNSMKCTLTHCIQKENMKRIDLYATPTASNNYLQLWVLR